MRGVPPVRGVDKAIESPHLKMLICFELVTNATGLDCSSERMYGSSTPGRGEQELD